MRFAILLVCFLLGPVSASHAQLSIGIGIGLPGVNIGINLPVYPELVRVPGYPVYYAPRLSANFFFYDGMYWVYQGDNWYASSWYNGPWGLVGPEAVPLFVLRIPVRYYRNPPGYFRGWRTDVPPRWGDHWGNDWQQRRSGWDQWNRKAVPAPAPLPVYQRQYSGNRYPQQDRQHQLQTQNYRYQPRETLVREHFQEQARAPAQRAQQSGPQDRNPRAQETQRTPQPPQQPAPPQQQQRGGDDMKRSTPGPAAQDPREQPRAAPAPVQREQARQAPAQREQPAPRPQQESAPQGKGTSQDDRRGQGQQGQPQQGQPQDRGRDRDKGDERGQDRNR